MINEISDDAWHTTTWEGNRRAQLHRSLKLTLRERLQAVEDMAEMARRLEEMRLCNPVVKQESTRIPRSHP